MEKHDAKRVLYIIVCAAGPAEHIQEFVSLALDSWDIYIVTTPHAATFINASILKKQTGHSVRSDYKTAQTTEIWPPFDAIVVAPATFNTLNKFALVVSPL